MTQEELNESNFKEIFKYLDLFGTKQSFYTEKKPRLYSVLGGVLSIISFLIFFCVFLSFNFSDLQRKIPYSSSSLPSEGFRTIRFGAEKIWIPWRIMDYFKTSFNFTNILFPVVYYHYTQKDITGDKVEIKTEKLNFRLCNESSMKNINDIHHINIPLEDLYCIDMDDLKMGGSWVSGDFHYVELDLYIYKNEINYHSEDSNCTSYENLTKIVGEKNSLQLNFYYPVVNFQLNNLSKPVTINYKEYNYQLSRYSNKISRIYLQGNILEDDLGWFYQKVKNDSFLAVNTINWNSYTIGATEDLVRGAL